MEAAALSRMASRGPAIRALGGVDDRTLVERVRTGDDAAFEALFDRHARGLVGFCRHLLGSREEAEDAVQHTVLCAYRAIRERDQHLDLKPWLYTIARNRCLSILRARREELALVDDQVATEGLAAGVDRRAELRALLADLADLPEQQRTALVLFELGDVSHAEIADVLGVPRGKVKALVFQAREHLLAARRARETPCVESRHELATATGAALRRGPLRRHVDRCAGCTDYEAAVRRQRAALAVVLPVVPSMTFRHCVLSALGAGHGGAGATGAAGAGAAGAATGGLSSATGLGGAGAGSPFAATGATGGGLVGVAVGTKAIVAKALVAIGIAGAGAAAVNGAHHAGP